MTASSLIAEPAWPENHGRPIVLLVDASNSLERRLIAGWIERNRPDDLEVETAELPPSRRHRRHRSLSPVLRAMVHRTDNPLLVPVRIAWLAQEHAGVRRVRISDLIMTGDPRDPDPVRARWLHARYPDRVRLVAGAPATVEALRDAWREKSPESDFTEFVAHRAWLALERAERTIRGNRYKVPKFVDEAITSRIDFQQEVIHTARDQGKTGEWGLKKSRRYLKEIAATHSPLVIDLVANAVHWLYRKSYGSINYDRKELLDLYSLGRQSPVAFVPSHKSNFDHLVLHYVLWENDFPPNHTAGGINMNFFPLGPIVRRAGVFFIRRSFKDNELYKLVLRRYIDYLVEQRFSLEWYMEGGRSRSGKLRPPKYGMFTYTADSFLRGKTEEMYFLPIAIAYDQVIDVGSYTAEQTGESKDKESASWLVRTIRRLQLNSGDIHVRFGEPLALSKELTGLNAHDDNSLAIKKLAFEVGRRVNRVTPVTPTALVSIALLAASGRALTFAELSAQTQRLTRFIQLRSIPTTYRDAIDTDREVASVLESLKAHGLLTSFGDGPEVVWNIAASQHLAAAYYRNTVVHFFLAGSIAEVALLAVTESGERALEQFWDEVMRLRDLLKFEFYFAEKERFRQEVDAELALRDPDWVEAVKAGPESIEGFVRRMPLLTAHWSLRPFLEAYQVIAHVLQAAETSLDEKRAVDQAMGLARQYILQKRVSAEESVSKVLFATAYQLARNRGLTDDAQPERLDEFSNEVAGALRNIDRIGAFAAERRGT